MECSQDMDFQRECLRAHNEYRQKHGVPPLKLNKDICQFSQQWANYLSKRSSLEHSRSNDYGENIFCLSASNSSNISIKGDEPVHSWYDEIKHHPFGSEPKTLSSGHFSQVLWMASRQLGVAFAKSNSRIIVVANYLPPGNIIGQFKENVPPPGGFQAHLVNTDTVNKISSELANSSISSNAKKTMTRGTNSEFEDDFLTAHNKYRSRHGVTALKLDKKLCSYSTEWAKILASKNHLEHRKTSPYGENIYCMYSSDPNFTITGQAPVDTWYEEVKQHPFGREPNNLKTGHFSQVVWKTSEYLGVGVAQSRQGYIYVVANYSPAGNFLGHFAENVPPLKNVFEDEIEQNTSSKEFLTDNNAEYDHFVLEALRVHNEYRRKHGVPEMKLNKQLCDYSKQWAEHCSRTGNMAHRNVNTYGENIFCIYSSDFSYVPPARDVIKKWYDEIKDHNFGNEMINYNSLHFSQVVWKSSIELGVSMAKNKKGQTYVVANYNPRGNIVGQFNYNVPKPRFGST